MPAPSSRPILWAEDNVQDQMLIRAALEGVAGVPDLRFAGDGVLLLQELEGNDPSLVVLDLKMPRLGGLETLRRIREDPRWTDLPVSVFSAGDQPEETQECRRLGALDVVRKPVDFRQFTQAVERIVSPARASQRP